MQNAADGGGIILFTNIPAPYRIPALNALARMAGPDFSVIFAAPAEARRTWRLDSRGMHFPWQLLSSTGRGGPLAALMAAVRIWNILVRQYPSAVICGGYSSLASWTAFVWCKMFRRRFVLWLESNGRCGGLRALLQPCAAWLKRLIISNADAVAVAGRASAAYVQSLGAPEDRIFTAPFGADGAAFAREAERANTEVEKSARGFPPRLALFAGRLVRAKGVFILLEAFRDVAHELPDAGLLIAGHGPEERAMREFCRRASLGRVFFEGPQEYRRMPYYYALADALVLPTFRDAWGFVVNEAFACGVPAIVARVAGAYDDLIVEGETGFGIEPGDPRGLAEALLRVLSDAPLRARMSARCRRKIQAYSAEACALGLYRSAQHSAFGVQQAEC